MRKVIKETSGVKEAYIYGAYARDHMDASSDIDLLVVGRHKIIFLQRKLNKIQREIDREVNVVNMDEGEFKQRIKRNDPFITDLLKKNILK